MPVPPPFYADVYAQVSTHLAAERLRATALARLALLVTGILLARSAVAGQMASDLAALFDRTRPGPASFARRLRRTLADDRLHPVRCYQPVVRRWLRRVVTARPEHPLVLIIDESSHTDRFNLFRVSLAYWGGSLPLAWALWPKNQPLPPGHYWQQVDRVLAETARLLPLGIPVLVLADRAYDNPYVTDRLAGYGWDWVIRVKHTSGLRFRDQRGCEQPLAAQCRRRLKRVGDRFKGRGELFKKAGWRAMSVVGYWAPREAAPVVVLSSLPPSWRLLAWYGARFWCEVGFRNDKGKGWQWEASQVRSAEHQAVLLVGLAWATLLTVGLGVAESSQQLAQLAARAPVLRRGERRVGHSDHPHQSVFRLGLDALRRLVYHAVAGGLADPTGLADPRAPSWSAQWRTAQSRRYLRFHGAFT